MEFDKPGVQGILLFHLDCHLFCLHFPQQASTSYLLKRAAFITPFIDPHRLHAGGVGSQEHEQQSKTNDKRSTLVLFSSVYSLKMVTKTKLINNSGPLVLKNIMSVKDRAKVCVYIHAVFVDGDKAAVANKHCVFK